MTLDHSLDLPNPLVIDKELHVWKIKWLSVDQERPKNLQDCKKVCNKAIFPNVFSLLKMRKMHAVRRMTDLVSSDSLQLHSKEISVDRTCALFLRKHARRMRSANLLFN